MGPWHWGSGEGWSCPQCSRGLWDGPGLLEGTYLAGRGHQGRLHGQARGLVGPQCPQQSFLPPQEHELSMVGIDPWGPPCRHTPHPVSGARPPRLEAASSSGLQSPGPGLQELLRARRSSPRGHTAAGSDPLPGRGGDCSGRCVLPAAGCSRRRHLVLGCPCSVPSPGRRLGPQYQGTEMGVPVGTRAVQAVGRHTGRAGALQR